VSAATPPAPVSEVRESRPDDVELAVAASALIEAAARENDIALRAPAWLASKIAQGRAAIALAAGELVGFGYWSAWEEGRFVSHSGLVVRPSHQGIGLGRRLKLVLFESSRRALPRATLMSLTTSPQVKALNLSLGFRVVPLERLTGDPAFWEGCRTCRNYEDVRGRGERCCCVGMILESEGGG